MSEIVEIIDTLEKKISKLFEINKQLEEKNQVLLQEIKLSTSNNTSVFEEIQKQKEVIDSLKMSNSLLGSEDYKRDTKLKINSLIREIDYCIAQLAD